MLKDKKKKDNETKKKANDEIEKCFGIMSVLS